MGLISVIVAFHVKVCSFDPTSTAIGIMTIFVTFLVGWNIYTLIDLRDFKDKEAELENRIENTTLTLETRISNNINTSIDLLNDLTETSCLSDKLIVYFSFYYVAGNNGSNAVKTTLHRIISNTILVILNGSDKHSLSTRMEVAIKVQFNYVRYYIENYSSIPTRNDEVSLWLENLLNDVKAIHRHETLNI